MGKIAIVIPYFGQLPNYFQLWALSASYNPTFDFFIITDIEAPSCINSYKNIFFVHMSLQEIRRRAEKILGFPPLIENPYKLCDYKPLYGLMFGDLISEYPYWGYGDIDVIYGNLMSATVIDGISQKNADFFFDRGHLAFFKNKQVIIEAPLQVDKAVLVSVFSTPHTTQFDEFEYSLPNLCRSRGMVGCGGWDDVDDIWIHAARLIPCSLRPWDKAKKQSARFIYAWHNGDLLRYEATKGRRGIMSTQTCLYIHLQKRPMKVLLTNGLAKGFVIGGDSFISPPNQISRTLIFRRDLQCVGKKPPIPLKQGESFWQKTARHLKKFFVQ